MREPAPDFSGGAYERVNQPWVCGLASEGSACPGGPTVRGDCPALAECAPLRDGDRWRCSRSDLRGGVCVDGPTPEGQCGRVHRCRPVRSLRAVRGRFVAACALMTAGCLSVVLSSTSRNRVIAPGPLASPHAQLLAKADVPADCAACHAAGQRSLAGLTATLVAGHGDGPTQSTLCMKCHGKTIPPEMALRPHNVSAELLRGLTEARDGTSADGLPRAHNASLSAGAPLACSTCHREHQGPHSNLTALDNAACQACHHERYESFATDHPELGSWPYERRTRIEFNHASHQLKHFAEKKQAFDCRMCHVEDAAQAVQLTAGYEAACAGCHDEKIATSVAQGVPMLMLPTLDVEALQAAGHEIDAWPEGATGDFDGKLPPMMKLLLAGDAQAAEAFATLGVDFEFLDVDLDDAKQLAAAADLATAIKRLIADLAHRGSTAVGERLSAALSREVTPAEVSALMGGLSMESIQRAAAWLPAEDGPTAKNQVAEPERELLRFGDSKPDFEPSGAWVRDDAMFTIDYRPVVHTDPVLAGWLQLLSETPGLEREPLALAMFKQLSNPTAPGLCVSCHSVEQTAVGSLAIHWRTATRSIKRREFTKFTHGPHVLLPQLADCTQCHAVDSSASSRAASYVEWDPHRFVSDFRPMSKRQCAECHTARAAGDRCQSCHNYHVEEPLSGERSSPAMWGIQ